MRTTKNLFPGLPQLFDDLLTKDLVFNASLSNKTAGPAVNVKESDDLFTIELAAPGLKKEAFKIELDNERLTISADKKEEVEVKGEKYTRQEFGFSAFKRVLTLPKEVIEHDKVKANYEDGILSISIPKREEAKVKPAREIAIG